MIVRPRPKPWQLLFIMRGSIVPLIWPQVLVVTAVSAVVVLLEHFGLLAHISVGVLPYSLMGIALSIFAGFRNSACYDRWWEARKVLGQLVIDCRSLARQARAYGPADDVRVVRLSAVFAFALRRHLRDEAPPVDVESWLGSEEAAALADASHLPNAVLGRMSTVIAGQMRVGLVSDRIVQVLEERVAALSGVLAACERIRATPLPYAYTLLLHRTCYVFCLLLPFGLAESAGLATPAVAAVVSYTFFGLDVLGDELERPFGPGQNAMPLDAICRTVEIAVRDELGERPLPQPLAPVDYVLT